MFNQNIRKDTVKMKNISNERVYKRKKTLTNRNDDDDEYTSVLKMHAYRAEVKVPTRHNTALTHQSTTRKKNTDLFFNIHELPTSIIWCLPLVNLF